MSSPWFGWLHVHAMQQNQIIHDLQQNLEQLARDKVHLEAELMKMSSYKSEVMILQSEIMKLQVSDE